MTGNNLSIPGSFRDKILRMFRDRGEAWINKLPYLLEEIIRKWELTECKIEDNLSIHFICYAHSPKYGDVVLKTGVPHLELFSGMDALLRYEGKHACTLLEADREQGAMLMERIFPGTRLRDEPDFRQRIRVGTYLAGSLPVAIHGRHDFPTYQQQMEKAFERARLEKRAGEEFISMLCHAEDLYEEILSFNRPRVLLHGDLHHENILLDASGNWKVIDPQGRIGEQCLEAGRFLFNEWRWFGATGDLKHMSECISSFAKALGESRRTIAASCFLDYALSSCWTLEDGGEPEDIKGAIQQMKILLELLK